MHGSFKGSRSMEDVVLKFIACSMEGWEFQYIQREWNELQSERKVYDFLPWQECMSKCDVW